MAVAAGDVISDKLNSNPTVTCKPASDSPPPSLGPPVPHPAPLLGPLMGGPQCRMSNLRNGNVHGRFIKKFHVNLKKSPMSHVDFKKSLCLPNRSNTGALDGGSPMSHVKFKKWQCRMSLSLISPQCHMSNLRKGYVLCHYHFYPPVACH